MNFPLVINVLVFVALLLLLAQTRHKQWSLAKKVLVGLVVGVVFGLGLQLVYGSDNPVLKESISWFNIVGNGYVQLLQMIVMPLVFASILSAVAKLPVRPDRRRPGAGRAGKRAPDGNPDQLRG